jgi:hypothetical protein
MPLAHSTRGDFLGPLAELVAFAEQLDLPHLLLCVCTIATRGYNFREGQVLEGGSLAAPLIIQQKNSEDERSGPIRRATRKGATEAWPPSANQSRKICQSQKFILRHNGVFRPCEIGKLIDSEGFSLFPRERK